MRTKKEIENEIVNIKKQMETLSSVPDSKVDANQLLKENEEKIGTQLFTLLKYMIEENKRTTMLLKTMSESIERLEDELAYYHEESEQKKSETAQPQQFTQKEVPLSGIDARLIQNIQLARTGMACAEDLKAKMNYKGKNAVSARLNRLYKMGILERHQLGKKVYYKYDAGKQTNILIVSPSQ